MNKLKLEQIKINQNKKPSIIMYHSFYFSSFYPNHSASFSTNLKSKYAMTTEISSLPNFKQGKSPIFEAFFLFLLFSSHLALHSLTRAIAAVSLSQCCQIKPQTQAEDMTSQHPSEPMTMNLSVYQSQMFWIQGSEIRPMRLAQRSPNERVMAMPGPYSSAHTLGGPTCCPSCVNRQIFPPLLSILSLSSGLIGLWSYDNSIANFSLGVTLYSTALESPKFPIKHLFP